MAEVSQEEQPTFTQKIAGTLVVKEPDTENPGVILILLEGGDVRWGAFQQKAEEATAPLPPPPPPVLVPDAVLQPAA